MYIKQAESSHGVSRYIWHTQGCTKKSIPENHPLRGCNEGQIMYENNEVFYKPKYGTVCIQYKIIRAGYVYICFTYLIIVTIFTRS